MKNKPDHFVIAIDGHSSCGKSTLAKDISSNLNILYIDSGAMYRATTLYFIDHHVQLDDADQIIHALEQIQISFKKNDGNHYTYLNGENVEDIIRSQKVAEQVSEVSRIQIVRNSMVQIQRSYSKSDSVVMDGRDIGTVVFPNADLKIFLTADVDIRAQRRFEELKAKGIPEDFQKIKTNLLKRDHIDSTRVHSPLKVADDAIVIDNSKLTRSDQLSKVLKILKDVGII